MEGELAITVIFILDYISKGLLYIAYFMQIVFLPGNVLTLLICETGSIVLGETHMVQYWNKFS